jgi:hypothetical protein
MSCHAGNTLKRVGTIEHGAADGHNEISRVQAVTYGVIARASVPYLKDVYTVLILCNQVRKWKFPLLGLLSCQCIPYLAVVLFINTFREYCYVVCVCLHRVQVPCQTKMAPVSRSRDVKCLNKYTFSLMVLLILRLS